MRRLVAAGAAAVLAVGLGTTACGRLPEWEPEPEPVRIVGVWTGPEQEVFERVLEKSGIDFVYTGSRNLSQLLQADVRAGTPPDIAVVASPTDLLSYYRAGELRPVTGLPESDYSSAWHQLVMTGEGKQYAVVLKADLKGIVWYDPGNFPAAGPPRNWDSLLGSTSWCMGLAADAASGFPGVDWIATILLRSAGPEAYTRWVRGDLPWGSDEVRAAFRVWGQILRGVSPGAASPLLTRFGQAGLPMLDGSGGCSLDSEGSFITSVYGTVDTDPYRSGTQAAKAGTDYDFFEFPASGPDVSPAYQVAGNFAGMFRDTPTGRAMMTYLAGVQAQAFWAAQGGYSANRRVRDGAYSDEISLKVAKILRQKKGDGTELCFGAADLMSPSLRAAFYQAVLAYAASPTDKRLKRLLRELDEVQAVQSDEERATAADNPVCGR